MKIINSTFKFLLEKLKNIIFKKVKHSLFKFEIKKSEPQTGIFCNDYLSNRKPIQQKRFRNRIRAKGKVHDIQEVFERLNTEYFSGKIEADITYSRHGAKTKGFRKSITLATFSKNESLIRIHPILDSNFIPLFFLEYIIHHEMLHEFLPPIIGENGRLDIHHSEFLQAEKEIPSFREATKWLRKNQTLFFNKSDFQQRALTGSSNAE